ncbi:hypothetical protein LINPERHAP1_LOCUS19742, partial [Linum perenne]
NQPTLQGRRSEELSVCCDVWQFLSIALNQLASEVTGMCDSTATSAFNGKFGWSWTEIPF